MNYFCELCDSAICPLCKVTTHKEHLVAPLTIKYKQLENELETSLRRLQILKHWRNIVNKSAEKAKRKIQHQLRNVIKSLNDACQQYKREIDSVRDRELIRLEEQDYRPDDLRSIGKQIKNVLENPSYSSAFVQMCKELQLRERKLWPSGVEWKRPVFRSPPEENWDSKDILGHWECETIAQILNSDRKRGANEGNFLQLSSKDLRLSSLDSMPTSPWPLSRGSSISSLGSLFIDEEEMKDEISDTRNSDPTHESAVVSHVLHCFHVESSFFYNKYFYQICQI